MNAQWWSLLGIAPTDDTRSVKRAYAIRLKSCRPEDDPEGFTQLREAYEGVLAYLQKYAKAPSTEKIEETANASTPLIESLPPIVRNTNPLQPKPSREGAGTAPEPVADTLVPNAEPIWSRLPSYAREMGSAASPQEVACRVLERAMDSSGSSPELRAWILSQQDLVSIEFKSSVAKVIRQLIGTKVILSREAYDALADFFGWSDDLSTNPPPVERDFKARPAKKNGENEFRRWLDDRKEKSRNACTLRAIRGLGGGRNAWLRASLPVYRQYVQQALRQASTLFGEGSLNAVLGSETVEFWCRVLTPLPNLLQLALTLPLAAAMFLLGLAVVVGGPANWPLWSMTLLWMCTLIFASIFCGVFAGMVVRLWQWRHMLALKRKRRALGL